MFLDTFGWFRTHGSGSKNIQSSERLRKPGALGLTTHSPSLKPNSWGPSQSHLPTRTASCALYLSSAYLVAIVAIVVDLYSPINRSTGVALALHPPRQRLSSPALWRQATGQALSGGTLGGPTKISQQLFLMHVNGMTLSNGLAFLRPSICTYFTLLLPTVVHPVLGPCRLHTAAASIFRLERTCACTCKRHDHSVKGETLG